MTPWPRLTLFPTIDLILAVVVSVWPSTARLIDRWWTGTGTPTPTRSNP